MFAYFYTVVPVFQHQQLQEQTAKLEIEKNAAERQLTSLVAQQAKVKDSINRLQSDWEKELAHSARLTDEVAKANIRESIARRQSSEIEIKLKDQLQVFDAARWELVLLDLTSAYYIPKINNIARDFNAEPNKEIGWFILSANKGWPKPYEELLSAVDAAAKINENRKKDIPDSYYTELKKFIKTKEPTLQCNKPDFDAIYSEYIEAVTAVEPEIDANLNKHIEKVRNEYAQKKQNVKITDEYRSIARRNIKIEQLYSIDKEYKDRLAALQKNCDEKAHRVMDEIRIAKGATR